VEQIGRYRELGFTQISLQRCPKKKSWTKLNWWARRFCLPCMSCDEAAISGEQYLAGMKEEP